jgi:hypothetical protein
LRERERDEMLVSVCVCDSARVLNGRGVALPLPDIHPFTPNHATPKCPVPAPRASGRPPRPPLLPLPYPHPHHLARPRKNSLRPPVPTPAPRPRPLSSPRPARPASTAPPRISRRARPFRPAPLWSARRVRLGGGRRRLRLRENGGRQDALHNLHPPPPPPPLHFPRRCIIPQDMGTHVECQIKVTGCPLTQAMAASGAPWFCSAVSVWGGEKRA